MADERIIVSIELDDGSIKKGFVRIQKESDVAANRMGKAFTKLGDSIKYNLLRIGPAIAGVFSIVAVKQAISRFIEFEKAVVGVGKTTNASSEELKILSARIQDLAQEIPVATNELLSLAQVAGQFGIRGSDQILKFVDTMARLNSATDIAGEEGARSIAKILAITKEGVKDIDKFGSTVVALGNTFETTESRILATTEEIIKGIGIYKVSAGEAAALGATLDSLGGNFSSAGTAVAKVFALMDKAIAKNGRELQDFAEVAGMSAEQFKKSFKEDSLDTFNSFVVGLSKISKAGGSAVNTLAGLGLADIKVSKNLLPLIDNTEKFTKALQMNAHEMRTGQALREESARAFNTLGSDVTRFGSALETLSNTLTSSSTGPLREFVSGLTLLTETATTFLRASEEGAVGELATLELAFVSLSTEAEKLKDQINTSGVSLSGFLGFNLAAVNGLDGLKQKLADVEAQMVANIQAQNALNTATAGAGSVEAAKAAADAANAEASRAAQAQGRLSALFASLGEFRGRDLFNLQENLRLQTEVIQADFDKQLISRAQFEEAKFRLQEKSTQQTKMITDEQAALASANQQINSAIVSGISTSIQAVGKAIASGENAFEALTGNILSMAGDLAISLGETTLATGIAKVALESLPGGAAIAAGLGLIALGTLLKTTSGSFMGGSEGTGVGAGGGAGLIADQTNDLISQEDAEFKNATAVTVNVEGTVLDPIGVGQQIAAILDETFNAGASTILVNHS